MLKRGLALAQSRRCINTISSKCGAHQLSSSYVENPINFPRRTLQCAKITRVPRCYPLCESLYQSGVNCPMQPEPTEALRRAPLYPPYQHVPHRPAAAPRHPQTSTSIVRDPSGTPWHHMRNTWSSSAVREIGRYGSKTTG